MVTTRGLVPTMALLVDTPIALYDLNVNKRPMKDAHIPARANQNNPMKLSRGSPLTSRRVNTRVWDPVKTRLAVSALVYLIALVAITLLNAVQKEATTARSSAYMDSYPRIHGKNMLHHLSQSKYVTEYPYLFPDFIARANVIVVLRF
jgi:hypothetical protein